MVAAPIPQPWEMLENCCGWFSRNLLANCMNAKKRSATTDALHVRSEHSIASDLHTKRQSMDASFLLMKMNAVLSSLVVRRFLGFHSLFKSGICRMCFESSSKPPRIASIELCERFSWLLVVFCYAHIFFIQSLLLWIITVRFDFNHL